MPRGVARSVASVAAMAGSPPNRFNFVYATAKPDRERARPRPFGLLSRSADFFLPPLSLKRNHCFYALAREKKRRKMSVFDVALVRHSRVFRSFTSYPCMYFPRGTIRYVATVRARECFSRSFSLVKGFRVVTRSLI